MFSCGNDKNAVLIGKATVLNYLNIDQCQAAKQNKKSNIFVHPDIDIGSNTSCHIIYFRESAAECCKRERA